MLILKFLLVTVNSSNNIFTVSQKSLIRDFFFLFLFEEVSITHVIIVVRRLCVCVTGHVPVFGQVRSSTPVASAGSGRVTFRSHHVCDASVLEQQRFQCNNKLFCQRLVFYKRINSSLTACFDASSSAFWTNLTHFNYCSSPHPPVSVFLNSVLNVSSRKNPTFSLSYLLTDNLPARFISSCSADLSPAVFLDEEFQASVFPFQLCR